MATANISYDNFIYQIEQITPVGTELNFKRKFTSVDANAQDPSEYPVGRLFVVRWLLSNDDVAPTDFYDRWAEHDFELMVFYPGALRWDDLHRVILQDRHDISKRLRDPAYFDGYNASNPSANTGIKTRIRQGDTLEQTENSWVLTQQWRCMVQEVEV